MFLSFSWVLVYFYTAIIAALSLMPISGPQVLAFQDKIIHFGLYFFLSLGAWQACEKSKFLNSALPAFIYAFVVGLALEIIQFFLPYRSFEFSDILFNGLGAFAGARLAGYARKRLVFTNK